MIEQTGYFCQNCTATKQIDWKHCPFCGIVDFYWRVDGKRCTAVGKPRDIINIMPQDRGEAMSQAYQAQQPDNLTISSGWKNPTPEPNTYAKQTSEDEEFERAIRVLRGRYDNLKRARKQRDKAEGQVKALQVEKSNVLGENIKLQDQVKGYSVKNVEQVNRITALQDRVRQLEAQLPEGMKDCTVILEECPVGHTSMRGKNWIKHDCMVCKIGNLEARIHGLLRDLDIARSRAPEPIKIKAIYGVRHGSNLDLALPIITMHQEADFGCVIRVGLPK